MLEENNGCDECSYSITEEELPGEVDGYNCKRPEWKETEYCIWHADVSDKPLDELKDARAETGERLDGAIINGVNFENEISFSDCSFINAQAVGATFSESVHQRVDFRNANLKESDFSSANLLQADFRDSNLSRSQLSDSTLNDTDFRGGNLEYADISNSNLRRSNLSSLNLSNTDLSGARLEKANLSNSSLTHRNLSKNNMAEVDLSGAKLRYTNLTDTNLTGANLSHSNLEDANLHNADVTQASFSEATLSKANCVDTNFEDADLSNVSFTDGDATRSNLKDVNANDSSFKRTIFDACCFERAKLQRVDFEEAVLKNANLQSAELEEAEFPFANLTKCNARNATFKNANLENANLGQADLRGSNLRFSLLYQVILDNSRINNETNFGLKCKYEIDPNTKIHFEEDVNRLQAAAWTYRQLESLYSANSLADQAHQYHIRKEESKRSYYREADNHLKFIISTINRWLTRHGEGLSNILIASAIVILGWAIIYPFAGGIEGEDGDIYKLQFCTCFDPETLEIFLHSIYFSISNFTTLGSNTYTAIGLYPKYLASLQALLGTLLVALFIFTLGRNVDR
ncbi:hypothetical protein GS429_20625 [Natronorubrum sp. JWXQ-INN-674]|uniref:Potassium channel domain-containing protein n=1 Tax=Natronorubrum halalkaliphilum TaxID=2691917 RepID=A0A6B0VSA4_9EURY|nr:pentapeptide repeat-containing protein [Natronorubrum halalkaliphilum]MXV64428.1 hypothetical protein [Natronorubrum halalkaliphilum]